jgi:hypothetical protein
MACFVCESRETIASVVRHQLIAEQSPGGVAPFIPLCATHCKSAEHAYRDVKLSQSTPVKVQFSGLSMYGGV